jgi:hypothetical protein
MLSRQHGGTGVLLDCECWQTIAAGRIGGSTIMRATHLHEFAPESYVGRPLPRNIAQLGLAGPHDSREQTVRMPVSRSVCRACSHAPADWPLSSSTSWLLRGAARSLAVNVSFGRARCESLPADCRSSARVLTGHTPAVIAGVRWQRTTDEQRRRATSPRSSPRGRLDEQPGHSSSRSNRDRPARNWRSP